MSVLTRLLELPTLCPVDLGMVFFHFHLALTRFTFFLISVFAQFSFSSELIYFLLFLLLISSFNLWWSDRIQCVISISLYLLRLALCPRMWSALEKVPLDAEKKLYHLVLGGMFDRCLLGLFDL